MPDLFTPNGTYGRASGERDTGREALRQVYAARAVEGHGWLAIFSATCGLQYENGRRVLGQCILLLFAEDGMSPQPAEPNLVADYDDVYELGDDDAWRYASCTVIHVFRHRGGKPAVLPLGSS